MLKLLTEIASIKYGLLMYVTDPVVRARMLSKLEELENDVEQECLATSQVDMAGVVNSELARSHPV